MLWSSLFVITTALVYLGNRFFIMYYNESLPTSILIGVFSLFVIVYGISFYSLNKVQLLQHPNLSIKDKERLTGLVLDLCGWGQFMLSVLGFGDPHKCDELFANGSLIYWIVACSSVIIFLIVFVRWQIFKKHLSEEMAKM